MPNFQDSSRTRQKRGKTAIDVLDLNSWLNKEDIMRALQHTMAAIRLFNASRLDSAQTSLIPIAIFSSAIVISAICLFRGH
ncbi:hypothetical protein BDW71DRAFT_182223 [Aspergillus fruticulosus]